MLTGIRIKTTSDTNGNSRSGVLVHLMSGASLFVRHDGRGEDATLKDALAGTGFVVDMMRETLKVAPSEYRRLSKLPGILDEHQARRAAEDKAAS
jgi:hypothetical protein